MRIFFTIRPFFSLTLVFTSEFCVTRISTCGALYTSHKLTAKFSNWVKWILSSDYNFVHFSLLCFLLSWLLLLLLMPHSFFSVAKCLVELAFSLAHLHIEIRCRKKQVSHFNCHLCLISVVVLNGLYTAENDCSCVCACDNEIERARERERARKCVTKTGFYGKLREVCGGGKVALKKQSTHRYTTHIPSALT